jgi:ribonuclease P protein component
MRFTSSQRLRQTAEYQAVRSRGYRLDCGTFLFSVLLQPGGRRRPPLRRLGVIGSKRVGDAVRRNAAKRRLREVFRLHQEKLPPDCDVVLIARRNLLTEPFNRTEERFSKACSKTAAFAENSRGNET